MIAIKIKIVQWRIVNLEIKTGVLLLNYFRNLLSGKTDNILPFPVKPQKPIPSNSACKPLPTCTPQSVNVSNKDLRNYIDELSNLKTANVHTVTVLRHGKIICKANFAPYSTNNWHISHSLCKTFTGIAIGMLVDDNLISTSDKICNIFPEKCNFLTPKRTKNITIEHLLTMTSGANFAEMGSVLEKDWVSAFFSYDCMYEPGTKFNYNSMNSYMLSAIVTKITGKTLYDFLKARLFDKLGFGSVAWESCPLGITKGGWGMYLLPEDAAKLGLLFNQNGKWHENSTTHTIVSETWINRSLEYIFEENMPAGYGYHLWYEPTSQTAIFNGIFGQNVFVNKQLDMVIVINSGSTYLNCLNPTSDKTCAFFSNVKNYNRQNFIKQYYYNILLKKALINLRCGQSSQINNSLNLYSSNNLFANIFNISYKKGKNNYNRICNALNGKKYKFTNCRFGLFPIMLSCMNDCYTNGLKNINFIYKNNTLCIIWDEGIEKYEIPISFDNSITSEISFNNNVFKIATTSVFTTDEDENLVLKISLNFLESSSTQHIKMFFVKGNLDIHLEETPNLMDVVHFAYSLPKQNVGPDVSFIVKNNYINKFAHKFCYPMHLSDACDGNEHLNFPRQTERAYNEII